MVSNNRHGAAYRAVGAVSWGVGRLSGVLLLRCDVFLAVGNSVFSSAPTCGASVPVLARLTGGFTAPNLAPT